MTAAQRGTLVLAATNIICKIYDEDGTRHDAGKIRDNVEDVLTMTGPALANLLHDPWALAAYYLGPMFTSALEVMRHREPSPEEISVLHDDAGQSWLVTLVARPPREGERAWWWLRETQELDDLLEAVLDRRLAALAPGDGAYGWTAREEDASWDQADGSVAITVLSEPEPDCEDTATLERAPGLPAGAS